MNESLTLRLDAIPGAVPEARRAITELCESAGLTADVIETVRLAVTEACANCVRHAYEPDAAGGDYLVEAQLSEASLVVVVSDAGTGLAEYSAGTGRGLEIMRKVASRVIISWPPGAGTQVEMHFDLDEP